MDLSHSAKALELLPSLLLRFDRGVQKVEISVEIINMHGDLFFLMKTISHRIWKLRILKYNDNFIIIGDVTFMTSSG